MIDPNGHARHHLYNQCFRHNQHHLYNHNISKVLGSVKFGTPVDETKLNSDMEAQSPNEASGSDSHGQLANGLLEVS